MRLIDIHTHNIEQDPKVITLAQFELSNRLPIGYYSFGIHPWNTSDKELVDLSIAKLIILLESSNPPLAIGECGLDKIRGASLDRQLEVFEQQLYLAVKFSKPVIVHCVKAWDHFITLVKRSCFTGVKIIIHGFRGSTELMKQLTRLPNIWLSFGEYYREDSVIAIPIDRMFIETDTSGIPIDAIYTQIANIKNISKLELVDQINKNFIQLK